MEEFLLTDGAFEGEVALMFLHMVMHGVLIFLCGIANCADKLTISILLILNGHG
jgi:hypothetical protein